MTSDARNIIVHKFAITHGNNTITRGLQINCHTLDAFDTPQTINRICQPPIREGYYQCYGCGKCVRQLHSNYVYSCVNCGNKFEKYRYLSVPLQNHVALVIGARTKIGHQVVLKLLRCGAHVIGTTRKTEQMYQLFDLYIDKDQWISHLHVKKLDLDTPDATSVLVALKNYTQTTYGHLDILINCAAQTIRSREKNSPTNFSETNRYADPKYALSHCSNSWSLSINELDQQEMEEVYRINAVMPTLIIQHFIPLLELSETTPYIINVHAREGLISVRKSPYHIHTNMAKSSLAMLTKCLCATKLKTKLGQKISIHGVDPGWVSVDEYYEDNKPFIVAPLDERDGAARILYPIFMRLKKNEYTRRHFDQLIY